MGRSAPNRAPSQAAAALCYRGAVARVERIEVERVTRMFGATAALRGVSARFEAGTITFLEGPNGAGKSTLLAVIGTVLMPTAGSVSYLPLGDDRELARAEIGWVSHDSHCYRELSARQNVELAAKLHGVDPSAAWREVSARFAVAGFADRNVGSLSRGQRQRVAVARALVHQPSVLLFDEPWTGLDFATADRLESILGEERDRGAIVIVVSHTPGLAERFSARRIRIQNGRIVKDA
jgi:heme exporter protein A